MSKRHYTTEFKREVLAMAAQGEKSIPELERDLGITPGLVYKWRRRYRINAEQDKLVPSAEREAAAEIRRLKREVDMLRQERDVLKKAIQIFSQDPRR
jgi:transposase